MFWVYDDLEKLALRLDRRVDKMVEVGVPTQCLIC